MIIFYIKTCFVAILVSTFVACKYTTTKSIDTAKKVETFTNPLLPSGADPWCVYKDGFYYYTHTTQDNITL